MPVSASLTIGLKPIAPDEKVSQSRERVADDVVPRQRVDVVGRQVDDAAELAQAGVRGIGVDQHLVGEQVQLVRGWGDGGHGCPIT